KVLGRVVDTAGKGVSASLQWTALDLWRPPHPMQDRRSASADGDGNFELWGTGARRYAVRARTEDNRIGYAIVDARSTTQERFAIEVRPATSITCDARGDDFAIWAVVVRNAAGELLDCRRIESRWRQQSIALPAGEYGIEIFDGAGTMVRRAPLVVGTAKQRIEVP
ncbi:MAG TPA: hypothetical protein VFT55_08975, partial [Planctomycetota bacterium]|nr:hypothetical protein [Planctomycetota bacterium]